MRFKIIILFLLFSLVFAPASSAHPGGLDKNGGHYCWTNCEKWGLTYGQYHTHSGSGSSGDDDGTANGYYSPEYIQANQKPTSTPELKGDRYATVTSVIDGDTIYVDSTEKVRFVGIDTPELGQKGVLEAQNYVTEKIAGKQIYLDVDDKKTKDKYGRTLAVILINGTNLNKELLCKGYAQVMFIPPSEFNPYDWKDSCNNASIASSLSTADETKSGKEVTELKQEIAALKVRLNKTEETIEHNEKKLGWLEEKVTALLKWFKWV